MFGVWISLWFCCFGYCVWVGVGWGLRVPDYVVFDLVGGLIFRFTLGVLMCVDWCLGFACARFGGFGLFVCFVRFVFW